MTHASLDADEKMRKFVEISPWLRQLQGRTGLNGLHRWCFQGIMDDAIETSSKKRGKPLKKPQKKSASEKKKKKNSEPHVPVHKTSRGDANNNNNVSQMDKYGVTQSPVSAIKRIMNALRRTPIRIANVEDEFIMNNIRSFFKEGTTTSFDEFDCDVDTTKDFDPRTSPMSDHNEIRKRISDSTKRLRNGDDLKQFFPLSTNILALFATFDRCIDRIVPQTLRGTLMKYQSCPLFVIPESSIYKHECNNASVRQDYRRISCLPWAQSFLDAAALNYPGTNGVIVYDDSGVSQKKTETTVNGSTKSKIGETDSRISDNHHRHGSSLKKRARVGTFAHKKIYSDHDSRHRQLDHGLFLLQEFHLLDEEDARILAKDHHIKRVLGDEWNVKKALKYCPRDMQYYDKNEKLQYFLNPNWLMRALMLLDQISYLFPIPESAFNYYYWPFEYSILHSKLGDAAGSLKSLCGTAWVRNLPQSIKEAYLWLLRKKNSIDEFVSAMKSNDKAEISSQDTSRRVYFQQHLLHTTIESDHLCCLLRLYLGQICRSAYCQILSMSIRNRMTLYRCLLECQDKSCKVVTDRTSAFEKNFTVASFVKMFDVSRLNGGILPTSSLTLPGSSNSIESYQRLGHVMPYECMMFITPSPGFEIEPGMEGPGFECKPGIDGDFKITSTTKHFIVLNGWAEAVDHDSGVSRRRERYYFKVPRDYRASPEGYRVWMDIFDLERDNYSFNLLVPRHCLNTRIGDMNSISTTIESKAPCSDTPSIPSDKQSDKQSTLEFLPQRLFNLLERYQHPLFVTVENKDMRDVDPITTHNRSNITKIIHSIHSDHVTRRGSRPLLELSLVGTNFQLNRPWFMFVQYLGTNTHVSEPKIIYTFARISGGPKDTAMISSDVPWAFLWSTMSHLLPKGVVSIVYLYLTYILPDIELKSDSPLVT